MKKFYHLFVKKIWPWCTGILLLLLLTATVSYAQITIDGDPQEWDDAIITSNSYFVHTPDPFGNGVVDNQFTEGSKDITPALLQVWAEGQTKGKNDIANGAAVLIDGIIYFAGDRCKIQGVAQIGFWFYLNGTAPVKANPTDKTGYFSPEHAVGDLFVLSDFSNGGRYATVTVYRWDGIGSDGNGILTPIPGAEAIVAINNGSAYPVPDGWSYVDTEYPTNAFYEGYINLADEDIHLDNYCFTSFLIETRSSKELTASLDDFVGGAFTVVPEPPLVSQLSTCNPEEVLILAASCSDDSELLFFADAELTIPVTPDGGSSSNGYIEATGAVAFWVVAVNDVGCWSEAAMMSSTVYEPPICSIEGLISVCPNSEHTYQGPVGENYVDWAWSISGDAVIKENNGSSVVVTANSNCGTFTVFLTVTDTLFCTSECNLVVAIEDTEKPTITNCPTEAVDLGCNPDEAEYAPSLEPDWSDNCGIKESGIRPGTPVADQAGCGWSVTHVYYAIDFCGNEMTCDQIFTWKEDLVPPVLVDVPAGGDLGCNPTLPACDPNVTATDNCDGILSVTCTPGPITGECDKTQTFTYYAIDECLNRSNRNSNIYLERRPRTAGYLRTSDWW
jgi:hypothetical protein